MNRMKHVTHILSRSEECEQECRSQMDFTSKEFIFSIGGND